MKKHHQQKLVILTLVLWVMFNFPMLAIFDQKGEIIGFPIIYFFIFLIWALSIVVSYIILKKYFE